MVGETEGVFVINLARRHDRRAWMTTTCLDALQSVAKTSLFDAVSVDELEINENLLISARDRNFAPYREWRLDAAALEATEQRWEDHSFAPVDASELKKFYGRSLNLAECACAISHLLVWHRIVEEDLDFALILEDDVVPLPHSGASVQSCQAQWHHIWRLLRQDISALPDWDLLYLGRNRFGEDGIDVTPSVCVAGFSSCAHAYVVSRRGAQKLISDAMPFAETLMPVDDWLPSLYSHHPRADIHALLKRFDTPNPYILALAYKQDRVWQLESVVELHGHHGTTVDDEEDRGHSEEWSLCLSDITGHPSLLGPRKRRRDGSPVKWVDTDTTLWGSESGDAKRRRCAARVQWAAVREAWLLVCLRLEPMEIFTLAQVSRDLNRDILSEVSWRRICLRNSLASLPASGGNSSNTNSSSSSKRSNVICNSSSNDVNSSYINVASNKSRSSSSSSSSNSSSNSSSSSTNSSTSSTSGSSPNGNCCEYLVPSITFDTSWMLTAWRMARDTRSSRSNSNSGGSSSSGSSSSRSSDSCWEKYREHRRLRRQWWVEITQKDLTRLSDWVLNSKYQLASAQPAAYVGGETFSWTKLGSVDTVTLSEADFRRKYDRSDGKRQPVVLRAAKHTDQCLGECDGGGGDGGCGDAAGSNSGGDVCGGGAVLDDEWSIAALIARMGYMELSCAVQGESDPPTTVRMSLNNYAHYMNSHMDADPLYLFADEMPGAAVSWVEHGAPPYFSDNLLPALATGSISAQDNQGAGDCPIESEWLVLGPAGSGSRWHIDPYGTSAWNLLLRGRKLWCLYPPSTVGCSTTPAYPPGMRLSTDSNFGKVVMPPAALAWFRSLMLSSEASACLPAPPRSNTDDPMLYWAEQREGDVVFVPHGWWHCVVNLEESVAFTRNVINKQNYRTAVRVLSETHVKAAERLQQLVWASRED